MAMRSPIEEQERPVTFEEYRALPNSHIRQELIGGEILESGPARAVHQRVLLRLAIALQKHADVHTCGEVFVAPLDVKLTGYTSVKPDIIYVSAENKALIGEDFIVGAPVLLIEVLSVETLRVDLVLKRAIFADRRVREYWIVDPNRKTIAVNVLNDDRYRENIVADDSLSSTLLPGFTIDVPKLFELPSWMRPSSSENEDKTNNDE
jgi:Uma2 family endonuclease